jgi:hypothetical protein
MRAPSAVILMLAVLTAAGAAGCAPEDSVPALASTTARTTLPAHFRIGGEVYGPVQDCRIDDDVATCTASWDDPYQVDTYAGSFTGTPSGLTMTGTWSTRQTGHDATDPNCRWQMETSAPAVYSFDLDGTVTIRQEAGQWRKTKSGNCSGTESGATEGSAEGGAVTWTTLG